MLNRDQALNAIMESVRLGQEDKIQLMAFIGRLLVEGRLESVAADPGLDPDIIAGVIRNQMEEEGG
jgi:hypothetical protein